MMKLLAAVAILALVELSAQQSDFCSPALCPNGAPHIACNGLQGLGPNCGSPANEVPMDLNKQTLIVDLHNQLRNTVAMGKQNYASGYYPQASRMATLQWDADLAKIAAANARRCVFGHDQCRNTVAFPYAGQNIASKSYYGQSFTEAELIKGFVDAWFSEYAYANPGYTAKYPENYSGPAIGHFTQIVSDRTTHVGCAMVTYTTAPWINQLFVCNYALTNIVGQPVYVPGNACSRCTTGCTNSMYPGLCSKSENIVPRP